MSDFPKEHESMVFLPSKSLVLLHISDLHIRKCDISDSKIEAPLWRKLCEWLGFEHSDQHIDLCVISGDLPMWSPSKKVYCAISKALSKIFPKKDDGMRSFIVAPGNHDCRCWGNIGYSSSKFDSAFPEWHNVWWHPELPLIIIPINSNPSQKGRSKIRGAPAFARGLVTNKELDRIPMELEQIRKELIQRFSNALAKKQDRTVAKLATRLISAFSPDTIIAIRAAAFGDKGILSKDYSEAVRERLASLFSLIFLARTVRCIVMHHHPVGIGNAENENLTNQEAYLTLVNAGEFIRTAILHNIDLVCHGHKHAPHRMILILPGHEANPIIVVGSGSTTLKAKYASATGNLIRVEANGEISVNIVSPDNEQWASSKVPLKMHSWSTTKRRLFEFSSTPRQLRENHKEVPSLLCARSATTHVDILESGDAIISRIYRGLKYDIRMIKDNNILLIPIDAKGSGHTLQPTVSIVAENRQFTNDVVLEGLESDISVGAADWHGFARPKTSEVGADPMRIGQARALTSPQRF